MRSGPYAALGSDPTKIAGIELPPVRAAAVSALRSLAEKLAV